jgi:nucleoside-diphosphate-sugar epimerase
VAQGKSYSLLDLVDALQKVFEGKLETFHTTARPGDVRQTLADISRAERLLGYTPTITFEEGIARTVGYFINRTTDSEVYGSRMRNT